MLLSVSEKAGAALALPLTISELPPAISVLPPDGKRIAADINGIVSGIIRKSADSVRIATNCSRLIHCS
ncbi:MAG: hypothetical protein ABIT08_15575 [Bacteroidia bacterium]